MLENIKTDIERLIALYEKERSERMALQTRLDQCLAENESCRKQIVELEQEVDSLPLTEASGASGDNKAAKEKIDKLVKEIDRCISLLEN
jgi:chromosome segregation ATPase